MFSSELLSFSSDADRAPQLKAGVRRLDERQVMTTIFQGLVANTKRRYTQPNENDA
jgi:hypothetical protein